MFIKRELIEATKRRLDFSPEKLSEKLGEGPRQLSESQREKRFRQVLAETGAAERAVQALERIVGGNDLVGINYLAKGMAASRSVCRIQLKDASSQLIGFATGFLIGPGVLMTNHHVFGKAQDAVNSILDFDYEQDITGRDRPLVQFALEPARLFFANPQLDFAVVAVRPRSVDGARELKSYGWLFLDGQPGKADIGEYLTIIQHPAGERKQVCVRENKLLKFETDTLWYQTDTLGGSSGSPAFNRFWQVVALHHSGVPKTNAQGKWLTRDGRIWDQSIDESQIDWIANEGIRVSSLVKNLQAKMGTHPLVKAALAAGPATAAPESLPFGSAASDSPLQRQAQSRATMWVEQDGNTASLVLPVRIPVDWVQTAAAATPAPAAADATASGLAALSSVHVLSPPPSAAVPDDEELLTEAVTINQKTLSSRPGYQANFLGSGALSVPLPKIPAALKSHVATLKASPSQSELKYFNYSVVMNKKRRLAFFSAVNIDGGRQQDVGKREGDKWLRDPRIDKDAQVGDEYYGKQSAFEADRTKNPFDRGHLVRRLDATWGDSVAEAKEHGDDSFHFTNCTPQFFKFNQGAKLWLGLEDFVLSQAVDGQRRISVINGPVFDGPEAPEDGLPSAGGKPKADPVFGNLPIPKYFWKLVVFAAGNKLKASAFLLSQQDQVLGIDRIHESDLLEKLTAAEAKVFQISIADLARFTRLDFGKLATVDTRESAAAAGPRLLESLEDIRLPEPVARAAAAAAAASSGGA